MKPVICAIDTPDINKASDLAKQIKDHVGAVKLGLEFFTANGTSGVRTIASKGIPIFLDLKLHDIPNTVAKAIEATAVMDIFMMTVHVSGGKAMLEAAVEAANRVATTTGKAKPLVVGVTVLTSFDQVDAESIGIKDPVADQVKRLAQLAQDSGLDGVVCSPQEIALLREQCGGDFTLVVPGIRPEGVSANDQKRIMTPKEAMAQGADYLVIGRPITAADYPKDAAQKILQSIGA